MVLIFQIFSTLFLLILASILIGLIVEMFKYKHSSHIFEKITILLFGVMGILMIVFGLWWIITGPEALDILEKSIQ